jgi:hypothetical protein
VYDAPHEDAGIADRGIADGMWIAFGAGDGTRPGSTIAKRARDADRARAAG